MTETSDPRYQQILEEYRFQVDLNWRRTSYFITLTLTLFSATSALLDFAKITVAIAATLYLSGAFVAFIGRQTLVKGHQYYRTIAYQKSQLELTQGQATIATTQGQQEAQSFTGNEREWTQRKLRPRTVTWWLSGLFWMLMLVNLLAVAQSIYWGISGRVAWF